MQAQWAAAEAKRAANAAQAHALRACSCVASGEPCSDPAGCLDWPNRITVSRAIAARIQVLCFSPSPHSLTLSLS